MHVAILTTERALWVSALQHRRLALNQMSLAGDYKPQPPSGDYDSFVKVNLADVCAPGSRPYLMQIDGVVESGRSWEVPTLIAHLLLDAGHLTFPEKQGDAFQPADGATVIMATGETDTDLNAVAGSYAMAHKIKGATPMIDTALMRGCTVHLVVPRGLPAEEREALDGVGARDGVQVHEVESLEDIRGVLGLPQTQVETPDDLRGPKGDEALVSSGDRPTAPTPFIKDVERPTKPNPSRGAKMLVVASCLIGIATLAWIWSDPSKRWPNLSIFGPSVSGSAPALAFAVTALTAVDEEGCMDVVMGDGAATRSVAVQRGSDLVMQHAQSFCGFEIKHFGADPHRYQLEPALASHAIAGGDALLRGVTLGSGGKTPFFFSSMPPQRRYVLSVEYGETSRAIGLVFERVTSSK
ncbi:MAG: hypothetical protein AAFR04_06565 [Pseudomonadota bacterium]